MPAARRIPLAQLEELVVWMEAHPEQAKGSTSSPSQANQMIRLLWDDLTSRLNAVEDGVFKTAHDWRVYWNDQKHKARRKKRELEAVLRTTLLTPIEQRIMALTSDLQYEVSDKISYRTPCPQVRESPSEPSTGKYLTLIVNPSASGTITTQSQKSTPQLDEPLQKLDRYDYIAKVWAETLRELPSAQKILAEKIMNDVFCQAQLSNLTRESHLEVENMEHHQVENVLMPKEEVLETFED